ncbi:MAG: hypothetical protein IT384_25880 [Deltaproteobacteria bacterium]|nr:hypothetical protein [Deltaproteobacteria bacterium]
MRHSMLVCATLLLASPAFAQEAPAGGMDMSKMGPWTRKPANEKATKKEIADFLKKCDEIAKKGDFQASLADIDFPVYMVTDDAKGTVESAAWDQAKYAEMMKPSWDNMPKDVKVTHKLNVVVLSDNLASVTDDFVMTVAKQKMAGRNALMLVKIGDQWKMKMMSEAGWGGMAAAPQAKAEAKPAVKPEAKPTAKK